MKSFVGTRTWPCVSLHILTSLIFSCFFMYIHRQASTKIAMRIGTSPIGPFTDPIIIYDIEIPLPNTFPYNAKAHPHLSEEGELLISYNVNTIDNSLHLQYGDIYRPRFIKLQWDDLSPFSSFLPGES